MKIRCFVSYSQNDMLHANRLIEKLHLLGVEIWWDKHQLNAGSDIRNSIENAIKKKTDVMFVIISRSSLLSPYVEWERKKARDASTMGHHITTVYIVVDNEVALPKEIREHLYIDFTIPYREKAEFQIKKELEATELLAKYLLTIRPLSSIGIYDAYYSYADLDRRRELFDGTAGANVYQFLQSAKTHISAVGFYFGFIFGMEGGTAILEWIRSHRNTNGAKIELFIPDPDSAPLNNLRVLLPHGEQIPQKIKEFIELFSGWGKQMGLSKQESSMITLTLLKCYTPASILGIDPDSSRGRIIASFSTIGYEKLRIDNLLHVEFRYPETPLYQRFQETLHFVHSQEVQTKTINTDYV